MTELYLLWCARRGRRLHLGFWTAYHCHLIATHPARNLTLCHILGSFIANNFSITEAADLTSLPMVRPPGLFDIPYFVRTNAVYMRMGRPHLYAMGEEATAGGRIAMLERTIAEMAEENRQVRSEMTRLASVMEQMLKESSQQNVLIQRQAAMETMVAEKAEENRQLKAEVAKLAGEVNKLLKGSAEQQMMRQRQSAMETIVSDLGEENFKMQETMNRLLTSMGEVLDEVTYLRKEQVAGTSGQGGRSVETEPPQIVTGKPEDKEAEVPARAEEPATETETGTEEEAEVPAEADEPATKNDEEDLTGMETDPPTVHPAPPAPRRSRRHR